MTWAPINFFEPRPTQSPVRHSSDSHPYSRHVKSAPNETHSYVASRRFSLECSFSAVTPSRLHTDSLDLDRGCVCATIRLQTEDSELRSTFQIYISHRVCTHKPKWTKILKSELRSACDWTTGHQELRALRDDWLSAMLMTCVFMGVGYFHLSPSFSPHLCKSWWKAMIDAGGKHEAPY